MSTIGIIAEYNPFHNGHLYMLNKAKEITGAEHSICVMSGNFMQRGIPALADKYSRAYAACKSGIDVCFELPVIYATGAAGDFALGAVSMLNRLNCVDYLCFGAETDDLELFKKITDILFEEPEEYTSLLKEKLKNGASYPSARAESLSVLCGKNAADIISMPNNILAIEYLLALKKTKSDIIPVIIKRKSAMYHDKKISGDISSATAIREALLNDENIDFSIPDGAYFALSEFFSHPILTSSDLEPYISYIISILKSNGRALLSSDLKSVYGNIADMSEEMMNRLIKCPLPASYDEICCYLKTRNITLTRVCRALIHLVLNMTDSDKKMVMENGTIYYANLLSFRKEASVVIKRASESNMPIITKNADYIPQNKAAQIMRSYDLLASELYNSMYYRKTGIKLPNEYKTNPLIA